MSKNIRRHHAYAAQRKFEVLGRFVQAYELMVASVRDCCITMTQPKGDFQGRAIRILLNHQSMSAQSLWDVMRGLLAEVLSDKNNKFPKADNDVALALTQQLTDDWGKLTRRRNDFLHGTWRIGMEGVLDPEPPDALLVTKYKVTIKGLQSAPPPKDVAEMKSLISDCRRLESIIRRLEMCLGWGISINKNFRLDAKRRWQVTELKI